MRDLWTGTYFRKWKQPKTGQVVDDSFIANLAGDFQARLSGLPRTLAPSIVHKSVEQTIARHLKPFYPMPPMQVTPDGKSTTAACYSLQHEPYLGCEAIYDNYVDDGLDTLKRIYFCVWRENHSPWDESLVYNAPDGNQGGLVTYMTCPTTWFALYALTGASLDLPVGGLYLSPRLTTGETELHVPIYFPHFWAWLDYVPAKHILTVKVEAIFANASGQLDTLRSVAADGDAAPIALAKPFVIKPGATLDLSGMLDKLGVPVRSDVVNFEVKAPIRRKGLPSGDWTLSDNLHDDQEIAAISGSMALDGNPDTRWTTGRSMQIGDSVTLDMKTTQTASRVVLDFPQSPRDYPRGYLLETSIDGHSWAVATRATEDQATSQVQNGILSITFPSTACRFIRITNEGTNGLFWSIHELYVFKN